MNGVKSGYQQPKKPYASNIPYHDDREDHKMDMDEAMHILQDMNFNIVNLSSRMEDANGNLAGLLGRLFGEGVTKSEPECSPSKAGGVIPNIFASLNDLSDILRNVEVKVNKLQQL